VKKKFEKGFIDIPIEKLVPAGWNYKDMESDQYKKLKEDLMNNFKRNGQVENIIVRELDTGYFEVCNGNHRFEVMKDLEYKNAHAFNMGKVPQHEAERLAIETNETKFQTDNLKLAKIIAGLQDTYTVDELCETMPYDEHELDNFNKMLEFDWEAGEAQEDEEQSSDKNTRGETEWKVLKFDLPVEVANMFEDEIDRFKKVLYPDEKPRNVSYVLPIEAMIQALNQVDDRNIIGDVK